MLTVQTLENERLSDWDAFVESSPDATFFHLSGWKRVLESTMGHKAYYLYAESNGQIQGVLPLFEVKSVIFGHGLISTPCCVYGGVVANSPEARKTLLLHAQRLADQLNVDYLELRHRTPQTDGWPSRQLHATFVRWLESNEDNLSAMKRKQRAVIRQAIAHQHQTQQESTLDNFYRIYSTSVRNLGTPVFSRRYFDALKQEFDDRCEIVTISQDHQPRCSLMSFYFRDSVLPYYGGGLPESRHLKSMDFMYWDQMQRAVDNGYTRYDFGRSKIDSGPYHYKRHWGFEPQPLCYEYHLVKAKSPPNLSPNNPKYRLMINLWKRLPLPISQRLGPMVSRYLG